MKDNTTFIGKGNRIYAINGEKGEFRVVGAKLLKGNKKLVDELALIKVDTVEEVKEIIMDGNLSQYSILGK